MTDTGKRCAGSRAGYAVLSSLLVCGAVSVAQAEETPQMQSPKGEMLDELVVTTTGAASGRQRHPGNITTLTSDDVSFVSPNLASDLLNRVPGVNIQPGSGVESLTAIRSPVLTGGAGAGSFLYLEDGISFRAPGFQNVNAFFDPIYEVSGGIEVIRGPASALYGSNAIHGLINFFSLPPSASPANELSFTIGSHGIVNGHATFSRVFDTDDATHGLRVTAIASHDDGWRANSGFDQQKGQIRYDYDNGQTSVRTTLSGMNLNQETASFIFGPDAYTHRPLAQSNPSPEAFRDAWSVRFASRWEHELSGAWLLSLTPYARSNYMNFLMHFLPGQPVETNRHWSAGLQSRAYYDLPAGHQIIFGLDTEYTEGKLREFQVNPTVFSFTQGLHYDYQVDALVVAPYIHSAWLLTPQTELTAGFRLEYTHYAYTNNAPDGVVGRFQRIPDQSNMFWDPTPKLGLAHTFSDEVTGFINLARGARAPQTTDLYRLQVNQQPNEIDSEKVDSAEIGARGQVASVSYEIAAYYMRKRNFHFRDADGFNVVDGKTNHLGVELEVLTPLPWGLYVQASGSYARHTYAFTNIVTSSSNSTESIEKGDLVDTAPRTLANVRFGYTVPGDSARIELEWEHVGPYWMDASNSQRYDGHDIFNLLGAYQLTENIRLFGRIDNLLNQPFAERADFAFGTERFFPGEERTYFLGGAVTF